jgi:formiminotetrahydrofolate cyclodeaminase
LTGALGAALGEMVIQYSLGKKTKAEHEPKLRGLLAEFSRARKMLAELMAEDQAAYDALSAARKAPRDEKAFNAALGMCIAVPQAITATALAMLDLCEKTVGMANPFLLSDLAIAADLAMATVRCGIYNVEVNLPDLSDAAEREKIGEFNRRTLAQGLEIIRRVSPAIWNQRAGKA